MSLGQAKCDPYLEEKPTIKMASIILLTAAAAAAMAELWLLIVLVRAYRQWTDREIEQEAQRLIRVNRWAVL